MAELPERNRVHIKRTKWKKRLILELTDRPVVPRLRDASGREWSKSRPKALYAFRIEPQGVPHPLWVLLIGALPFPTSAGRSPERRPRGDGHTSHDARRFPDDEGSICNAFRKRGSYDVLQGDHPESRRARPHRLLCLQSKGRLFFAPQGLALTVVRKHYSRLTVQYFYRRNATQDRRKN